MMILFWSIVGFVVLAIVLEMAARLYHRSSFLVPFRSRRVGEYPFTRFTEQQDPPLYFRFKKGFRSPMVSLNRFGLRGPDPSPRDGT